jgi:hypothetical protein
MMPRLHVVPFGEARRAILAALDRARFEPRLDESDLAPAGAEVVASLPVWVRAIGLLRQADDVWLLVEAETEGPDRGGQFTVAVPAGRYFVDTLDADRGEWIARESGPGGPLVAGLVCPGSCVVVRVRRLDDEPRIRFDTTEIGPP